MRNLLKAIIPSKVRQILKTAVIGIHDPVSEIAGHIKGRLAGERIEIIFDIGANVGQSVVAYSRAFPAAHVYAFEPDPETFQELQRTIDGARSAKAFNYGLGSRTGRVHLDASVPSDRRKIVKDSHAANGSYSIELRKLDEDFPSFGIAHIDYLKIDTEGHDLEVLEGASELLRRHSIKIVETECGLNRDNTLHVPLSQIQQFLEDFGYRLFHLFEQAQEWPTGRPNLRRVNAVFISPEVIERNQFTAGS